MSKANYVGIIIGSKNAGITIITSQNFFFYSMPLYKFYTADKYFIDYTELASVFDKINTNSVVAIQEPTSQYQTYFSGEILGAIRAMIIMTAGIEPIMVSKKQWREHYNDLKNVSIIDTANKQLVTDHIEEGVSIRLFTIQDLMIAKSFLIALYAKNKF